MAGIRISELDQYSYSFLKANANSINIPASFEDTETGAINLKTLLHDVVEDSAHEKNQNTAIETNTQNITYLSTEVNTFIDTQQTIDEEQNAKIEQIENISVWDKETFHN